MEGLQSTAWQQEATAAGLLEATLKAENRQNKQPLPSGASFTGSFTCKARLGLQGGKHRCSSSAFMSSLLLTYIQALFNTHTSMLAALRYKLLRLMSCLVKRH